VQSAESRRTFRRNTSPSSSGLKSKHRTTRRHIPEGTTLHRHRCENPKSYTKTKPSSAYSSTLKMEMIYSSERSADFRHTKRRFIARYRILHASVAYRVRDFFLVFIFMYRRLRFLILSLCIFASIQKSSRRW
jgi:hypothetical protein